MMKAILKIIKKVILSGFSLYLFNLMILPFNIVIPINIITILFVMIFGIITLPFFAILLIFFF